MHDATGEGATNSRHPDLFRRIFCKKRFVGSLCGSVFFKGFLGAFCNTFLDGALDIFFKSVFSQLLHIHTGDFSTGLSDRLGPMQHRDRVQRCDGGSPFHGDVRQFLVCQLFLVFRVSVICRRFFF